MPRALVSRLAAVIVAAVGLVVLALGVTRANAEMNPPDVVGRLPAITEPVMVTAPGMTELLGSRLRVRAAADRGRPVFIGVGRSDDVEAYLGSVARAEVTALEDSGVLRVVARPGEARLPDPWNVDVWAAEVRGSGSAMLTWPQTPGRWRLVVATDGATPPSAVDFTWSGSPGSSSAPAMIAVGAVLLVAGLVVFAVARSGWMFAPAPASRTPRARDRGRAAAGGGVRTAADDATSPVRDPLASPRRAARAAQERAAGAAREQAASTVRQAQPVRDVPNDTEEPVTTQIRKVEPIDAEPIDVEPIDAEPIDAEPIDVEPIDAGEVTDAGAPTIAAGRATDDQDVTATDQDEETPAVLRPFRRRPTGDRS